MREQESKGGIFNVSLAGWRSHILLTTLMSLAVIITMVLCCKHKQKVACHLTTNVTCTRRAAVYQRRENGNSYDKVSSVFTVTGSKEIDQYDCDNLELGQNEHAQVEVGDVIGVCINGPPMNAHPLFVVGRGAPGHSLMGGESCSYNSLPVSANPQNRIGGLILHVYAAEIIQTTSEPQQ